MRPAKPLRSALRLGLLLALVASAAAAPAAAPAAAARARAVEGREKTTCPNAQARLLSPSPPQYPRGLFSATATVDLGRFCYGGDESTGADRASYTVSVATLNLSKLTDTAKSLVGKLLDASRAFFHRLGHDTADLATDFGGLVADGYDEVADSVGEVVDDLEEEVDDVWDTVTGWFGNVAHDRPAPTEPSRMPIGTAPLTSPSEAPLLLHDPSSKAKSPPASDCKSSASEKIAHRKKRRVAARLRRLAAQENRTDAVDEFMADPELMSLLDDIDIMSLTLFFSACVSFSVDQCSRRVSVGVEVFNMGMSVSLFGLVELGGALDKDKLAKLGLPPLTKEWHSDPFAGFLDEGNSKLFDSDDLCMAIELPLFSFVASAQLCIVMDGSEELAGGWYQFCPKLALYRVVLDDRQRLYELPITSAKCIRRHYDNVCMPDMVGAFPPTPGQQSSSADPVASGPDFNRFLSMDANLDMSIDRDEFFTAVAELGLLTPMLEDGAADFFSLLDVDQDGTLSAEEFSNASSRAEQVTPILENNWNYSNRHEAEKAMLQVQHEARLLETWDSHVTAKAAASSTASAGDDELAYVLGPVLFLATAALAGLAAVQVSHRVRTPITVVVYSTPYKGP